MSHDFKVPLGKWLPGDDRLANIYDEPERALPHLNKMLYVLEGTSGLRYAVGGTAEIGLAEPNCGEIILALAPPITPAMLGTSSFCRDHGLTYPCYAGSMAHGISSEQLVTAMGTAGMLGFFGTAGLSLEQVEDTVRRLLQHCAELPFGVNVIHRPDDKAWEQALVDLLLKYRVSLIEASAYIRPSPALVKYRVKGMKPSDNGTVFAPNSIIAKVSRQETARHFLEPPPKKLLEHLLSEGHITTEEARLAQTLPLAMDITVEADSAGHTDHRSALAMLPSVIRLAKDIHAERGYTSPPRIGLAGGIGTPAATAAAFSMGAAYIVTGSVNQACVESGTSPHVRNMLAQAAQTDVADAPAADTFERGGKVQVLKKGTRFAERANKLYAYFRHYAHIGEIPPEQRLKLEETIFRNSLEEIWLETKAFFETRNPRQLEIAQRNPKQKMALLFRWYLGHAVRWACDGTEDRAEDYQIWCGPAMGAFNEWTRNTFLEEPEQRSAPLVALNLLYGAALLLRLETLRAQGITFTKELAVPAPVKLFPDFMKIRVQRESLEE